MRTAPGGSAPRRCRPARIASSPTSCRPVATASRSAADLDVPGVAPVDRAAPAIDVATVDGYEVRFDGALVAGTESELTLTVTP